MKMYMLEAMLNIVSVALCLSSSFFSFCSYEKGKKCAFHHCQPELLHTKVCWMQSPCNSMTCKIRVTHSKQYKYRKRSKHSIARRSRAADWKKVWFYVSLWRNKRHITWRRHFFLNYYEITSPLWDKQTPLFFTVAPASTLRSCASIPLSAFHAYQ